MWIHCEPGTRLRGVELAFGMDSGLCGCERQKTRLPRSELASAALPFKATGFSPAPRAVRDSRPLILSPGRNPTAVCRW